MDRIRLAHGSTTLVKEGFGSYHSRSTVMGGSAIYLAARKLQTMLKERAALRFGCVPEQVVLVDCTAVGPDRRSVRWCELGDGAAPLEVEESFANHHHTYAYGTAATHVAVDPKTGHVEILDYLVVEDVGRIVNPLTLHGQAIGAIVQGIGGTLLEHLIYDEDGQFLTGTLADYLIPSATDFPNVRAIMVGLKPSPHNPLGLKGGGEGGIISVGGVIANAVANALAPLGAKVLALPLSPSRVWHMVEAASRSPGE
jgi:carbon-monoxide dehydrogenase large subunit